MDRNKARPKQRRSTHHGGKASEAKQMRLHDKLVAFEEFEQQILPALVKDLKSGMTPSQLREKYDSIVQARAITTALTEADSGKAMTAVKDILDRTHGKAVEKKEVTHRLQEVSDQELDAIIKSEEEDLEDMEQRFDN